MATWYWDGNINSKWSNTSNWWSAPAPIGFPAPLRTHPSVAPWTTSATKDDNLAIANSPICTPQNLSSTIGDPSHIWSITGTCSIDGFLNGWNIYDGTFTGNSCGNSGDIYGGTFSGNDLVNIGNIHGGTFSGSNLTNTPFTGNITGGTFTGVGFTWYWNDTGTGLWSDTTNWFANTNGTGLNIPESPWSPYYGPYASIVQNLQTSSVATNSPNIAYSYAIGDPYRILHITGTCNIPNINNSGNLYDGNFSGSGFINNGSINSRLGFAVFSGSGFINKYYIYNIGTCTGDNFLNMGYIIDGHFTCANLLNGDFSGTYGFQPGYISGGIFTIFGLYNGNGSIYGGIFSVDGIQNGLYGIAYPPCEVSGGVFTLGNGTISGGVSVVTDNIINGGIFTGLSTSNIHNIYSFMTPNGISGGTFYVHINNDGEITGGNFGPGCITASVSNGNVYLNFFNGTVFQKVPKLDIIGGGLL